MSRHALLGAAALYAIAAIGPAVPPHMRVILACYAVANIGLSLAV